MSHVVEPFHGHFIYGISVWNYGVEELKSFLEHLNFRGGDLKFTIELEEDNKLPFLDVLF